MKSKSYIIRADAFGRAASVLLNDTVTVMCPRCYNTYKLRATGAMCFSSDNQDLCDLIVAPKIHAECSCSYSGDMVCLDSPIAHSISVLNKKGYKTAMSCSGHTDDSACRAFIKFVEPYDFNTLPALWSVRDGIWLECFDKNVAMWCLAVWVDSLPSVI